MRQGVFNPFLPLSAYIPDGEPHVFGDRVYLFGSHDKESGDTFCMLDYEIWSAPVDDLSLWTSKGPNYSARQDPLYSETMRYMYAPDCVQGKDGRFYLYYCLSGDKGQGGYSNPISVAVCDTPDGKYEYLGTVRNPDGTPFTRLVNFDPALLNDNGTIRLYFGTDYPWLERIPFQHIRYKTLSRIMGKPIADVAAGITGAYHVTLADDMRTVTSTPARIDSTISGTAYQDHKFFEGSSIRKIGDTYYFIYSTVNNHELCYATSTRPDGGFVYGGTIVSNGDIGYQGRKPKDRLNRTGNNHGSIECINGQWYVFYHRHTHNTDYSRQACAERIQILPDGSIPQAECTSCGLNGGPLKGGTYPAVICCNLTNGRMSHSSNSAGRKPEPCITNTGEERYITGITDGTTIAYKYFSLGGKYRLSLTVRGAQGVFETNFGAVLSIGRQDKWTTVQADFQVHNGIYPLVLTFRGKGRSEFRDFSITRRE